MKIKLTKEQTESMLTVASRNAERISFPSKIRFYYEDGNFIIEIFDRDLIEPDKT